MNDLQRLEFTWGVKIRLRDGVHLNASLYLPRSLPKPAPCVFTMSPYVGDVLHDRGVYFATHGTPFLIVDVRGRGNSEGEFRPAIQEAKDGYDVVEWLARQPYCDGKVAMWGSSYLGYSQWVAAKELPPHLATIVPTAAPYFGVEFPMRNNIFYPYVLQWIALTAGRTAQSRIFADGAFWSEMYRRWHESGRAFRDADVAVSFPSDVFQEWLEHPAPDEYWDAHNPTPEDYARLQLPILTITGSYDDDQPGALEHYRLHMKYGSEAARARHHLVIGPWDHWGANVPRAEFGGLKFGPQSLIDIPQLHLDWYAWTMQAGPKPEFLQKRVAYYVIGAEQWRYADTLQEITAGEATLFLDSAGRANDVFASGSLRTTVGAGGPDTYTYDPRETSGPEVAAEAKTQAASLVDQSVLLALRGKVLVYHSEPFEHDTEITGFFKLSAWIAIDCPDTDIYVSVHEIDLNGDSVRLCTDAMRARYREGLRTPKLIRTREPLRYDFERFTFMSRLVKRGHRLRLVIAPIGRLIETTFAEKNYNSGGVVAEETAVNGRAVTVRLYHDSDHPSALRVPLGRA